MPIEGDLKEIDLTSVIQVICTERRRAGLVVRRRGEEGVIFFDEGEIVHATLGPLEGEEAVFQLLAWKDGSFRMSDRVMSPARSVRRGWNHLLLEGLTKLDEERRDEPGADRPDFGFAFDERQADADFEGQLALFLSELEQQMVRLGERRIARRPPLVLEVLAAMVNRVVEFAEIHTSAGAEALSLDANLRAAGQRFPMARLLTAKDNRLAVDTAENLYRMWAQDSGERRVTFRELGRGMAEVTRVYLELLASQFHSRTIAEQWRESYAVFLRDLARAIDRVRF
jgi:hypothetical protein